ncbi:hypothetical protein C1884_29095 [Pseudomonas sp. GW460-R15]|nr:hypothetical protein C1887_28945 [Pseudomonas sp. GW456-R21]POA60903.1 hypothetical protein C1884_29095 [Pseudomonas sp. GW460-R15]
MRVMEGQSGGLADTVNQMWEGPGDVRLLAKTDWQPTSMLNVPTSSRASPLPQVLRSRRLLRAPGRIAV